MPSCSELQGRVLIKALSGAAKGCAGGAAASIASGAAIICSAPAWLPCLGGSALLALGTVATWSAFGGGLGAVLSGVRAYLNYTAEQQAFEQAFPPNHLTNDERTQHEPIE